MLVFLSSGRENVTLDGKRGKQTAVKVLHGAGVLKSTKQVPGSSGTYYKNL
jgi:hypothetical protein